MARRRPVVLTNAVPYTRTLESGVRVWSVDATLSRRQLQNLLTQIGLKLQLNKVFTVRFNGRLLPPHHHPDAWWEGGAMITKLLRTTTLDGHPETQVSFHGVHAPRRIHGPDDPYK